jgi:hypothetical protein
VDKHRHVVAKGEREVGATVRVTHSPIEEETNPPWEYEEDWFVSWVDETFLENHKKEGDPPFPTLEEALNIVVTAGYGVEVIRDVA